LTDAAYARLLGKLADLKFVNLDPELRQNMLAFYHDPKPSAFTMKNSDKWQKTLQQIEQLKLLAARSAGGIEEAADAAKK
jgi:conjugal transfer/entry exclusion protein